MKLLKITFLMVLLLVGCEQAAIYQEPVDEPLYASFELSVNYTDYIMMTYLEVNPKVYEVMYTHKLDYLVPQIFYFIPQNLDLDSEAKWATYFENWSKALEEENMTYIESYIKNTTIEHYVVSKFGEPTILSITKVLVEQYADDYIESFESYEKKQWPVISNELSKRVNYINEDIKERQLVKHWFDLTGDELESYEISLSYYRCPDMENSSISKGKSVLYNSDKDINEVVDDISLSYGKSLIRQHVEPLIKEMYQQYAYLDEPLVEYIGEITEELIRSYDTEITGIRHEKIISLPPIVTDYFNDYCMYDYFEHAYVWFLEDKKKDKAYLIEGQLNYKGQVYNKKIISKDIIMYYLHKFPIVIDKDDSYNILTNSMDSVPELSPSGNQLAFISPFGFEMIADLYVYDFTSDRLETVIKSMDETVKVVKWYDENTLLYIAGFSYGTVTRGGSLYKLDLLDQTSTMLIAPETSQFEISDIYYNDGWYYTMTVHDEAYMTFELIDYKFEVK